MCSSFIIQKMLKRFVFWIICVEDLDTIIYIAFVLYGTIMLVTTILFHIIFILLRNAKCREEQVPPLLPSPSPLLTHRTRDVGEEGID